MEEKKSTVMTPEEFAERMDHIQETFYMNEDDLETCHNYMDKAMVELLRSLGYDKGCDIFQNTPKWYS